GHIITRMTATRPKAPTVKTQRSGRLAPPLRTKTGSAAADPRNDAPASVPWAVVMRGFAAGKRPPVIAPLDTREPGPAPARGGAGRVGIDAPAACGRLRAC